VKLYWRLALVSFLILFLELLIIRLVGTEIRIFAYLGNMILLSIFIGSGIGMYIKKSISPSISAVLLFFVSALTTIVYILRTPRFDVKLFSGISELLSPLSEAYIWQTLNTFSKSGAIFGLLLTGLIIILLAGVFVPLGNLLGKLLDGRENPLKIYSVNVAASLAGMWAFQLFSLLGLPPLLGIAVSLGLLFFLVSDLSERYLLVAAAMAVVALTAPHSSPQPYEGPTTFWSPYQKLTISPIYPTKIHQPKGYYLEVNNVGYMGLLNLDETHIATASAYLTKTKFAKPQEIPFIDQYLLPYQLKRNPENVLIIGAGAGNDAAGAVRGGAKSVDAVEIDPVVIKLGRLYHPDRPYQKPEVNIFVTDGREFMERTAKKYDLIVMGLADSHTLSSSLTNLRLDHYLYTQESLARAKELLQPDGVLVLSFEVTRPWIGERLYKTVNQVFGDQPLAFEVRSDGAFGWGGYFFVAAKQPQTLDNILSANPDLANFVAKNAKAFQPNTRALTDDWPYLYLDKPRLPLIHLLMAGFFIGALAVVKKYVFKQAVIDLPMFFWGAAFLLFEFQNISKASLLFGLTWQTNMIIITAALSMILAANYAVYKKLMSPRAAFIGLILSLLTQFFIPLHSLNRLPPVLKLIVGGGALNLPFFFGGIIFAGWFAKAKDKSRAFASNLFGSAFGGLLEMISFLTGIKFLLVITLAFYTLGWFIAGKRRALRYNLPYDN